MLEADSGCAGPSRCRRTDSSPRHADDDSCLIWLSHRKFEAGWTRRLSEPCGAFEYNGAIHDFMMVNALRETIAAGAAM
jgi:hypothetical protein